MATLASIFPSFLHDGLAKVVVMSNMTKPEEFFLVMVERFLIADKSLNSLPGIVIRLKTESFVKDYSMKRKNIAKTQRNISNDTKSISERKAPKRKVYQFLYTIHQYKLARVTF